MNAGYYACTKGAHRAEIQLILADFDAFVIEARSEL